MSERCTAISIVVCFLIFIVVVYFIPDWLRSLNFGPSIDNDRPTLTLFRRPPPNHPEFDKVKVQCNLSDAGVKSPLLESGVFTGVLYSGISNRRSPRTPFERIGSDFKPQGCVSTAK